MYKVTKTYGHEEGLSCVFRQHRAESHCRLLHGYALAFKLTFEANTLDRNGWVIDFGSLKPIREFLHRNFDHTLAMAEDDPQANTISGLDVNAAPEGAQIADVVVLPAVGCEAFAHYVFHWVKSWLDSTGQSARVALVSVECREHGANSAIYHGN